MKEWTIALAIDERLRELGWTQQQLADALGRRQPTVSRWRSGHQLPQIEDLPALADWLEMPLAELEGWWLIETKVRYETGRSKDQRITELLQENADLRRQLDEERGNSDDGDASRRGSRQPRHARHRQAPPSDPSSPPSHR